MYPLHIVFIVNIKTFLYKLILYIRYNPSYTYLPSLTVICQLYFQYFEDPPTDFHCGRTGYTPASGGQWFLCSCLYQNSFFSPFSMTTVLTRVRCNVSAFRIYMSLTVSLDNSLIFFFLPFVSFENHLFFSQIHLILLFLVYFFEFLNIQDINLPLLIASRFISNRMWSRQSNNSCLKTERPRIHFFFQSTRLDVQLQSGAKVLKTSWELFFVVVLFFFS